MKDNRIVVSDATPIIALEKLNNGFEFIRKIYDEIFVPSEVLREISEKEISIQVYLSKHSIHDLLVEENPRSIPALEGINNIDKGERDSIALAYEKKLPILIHERKGRNVARNGGLEIRGIAGEIIYAYTHKLINKDNALSILSELYNTEQISTFIYEKVLIEIN